MKHLLVNVHDQQDVLAPAEGGDEPRDVREQPRALRITHWLKQF